MKLLIVFIMALACAHGIFPKLVLEFPEEDEEDFIKIPKLNLFPKPLFFEKLIKKKEKKLENLKEKQESLEEKLWDTKLPLSLLPLASTLPALPQDDFELKLLDFLNEKPNAKIVFEKLAEFQPDGEPACRCKPLDDCEYFS